MPTQVLEEFTASTLPSPESWTNRDAVLITSKGQRIRVFSDGARWLHNILVDPSTGALTTGDTSVTIPSNSDASSVFDSGGEKIGLIGNLFEALGDAGVIPNAVIPTAPLPVPIASGMDCGAYWYNDFGLEYTRVNAGSSWMGWYDWRWNFRSTDGFQASAWSSGSNYSVGVHVLASDGLTYISLLSSTSGSPKDPANGANPTYWKVRPTVKHYPDRMPLLGWYRGDDARVISWQVKWLVEHGCTWSVVQQRSLQPDDAGNWATSSSVANWVYKLTRDRAVLAGLFKLAYWMPHTTSSNAQTQVLLPLNGVHDSATIYTPGMRVVVITNGTPAYYRCILTTTNGILISNTTYWTAIPTYSSSTNYSTGAIVFGNSSSGTPKFWIAIANSGPGNGGAVALGNNASWQVLSDFNSTVSYTPGMVAVATAGDGRQYVAAATGTGAALGSPTGANANWTVRQFINGSTGLKTFIDFHNTYKDQIKTFVKGGRTYMATFMWESEVLRGTMGTSGAFIELMQQMGAYANSVNSAWDGIAFLMRGGAGSPSPTTSGGTLNYESAESTGRVLIIRTEYTGSQASIGAVEGPDGYQSLVDNFGPSYTSAAQAGRQDRRVFCHATALTAIAPHDSLNVWGGHSPDKFEAWVRKGRRFGTEGRAFSTDDGKQVILIYNVAEWTEGGPGLQPNMQDGFGYLTALKNAVT